MILIFYIKNGIVLLKDIKKALPVQILRVLFNLKSCNGVFFSTTNKPISHV